LKKYSLSQMVGGWFVGDYSPTVLRSGEFEVAVKFYDKGDREGSHHHKRAEEITVIASGKVRMRDQEFTQGDIILIPPGESTDFEALEATTTVVVKRPSVMDDKYID